ncbi:nicotinate (nicotinamide) nucleotide adenylyltransferase [Limnobacter sp.]|uniref:nicotinate (nicotinamide) nucleotide adenylyltransferase n=1 Tax=Limnobacter sp. TaxID=2003368 RepID=UPI003514E3C7
MSTSRQICIIGGTFNPVHLGHLQMARSAQAQCMADEVWFLPAGQPWQKPDDELAPAESRRRMVELAIEGVHSWRLEAHELLHSGPTYTVDTLEHLCDQFPDHAFSFVIGTDQLDNLTSWKHWRSLFDYARIGVVDRLQHGEFKVPDALKSHLVHNRLFRIPMPAVNVSSTHIRRQFELMQSGNPEVAETARYRIEASLPGPVYEYLMRNPIYGRPQP